MSDDPCWLPLARSTRARRGGAVMLVRSGVLAAFVALAGCAEPIVLRPSHPEHQVPSHPIARALERHQV